jgi:hypothetical protein
MDTKTRFYTVHLPYGGLVLFASAIRKMPVCRNIRASSSNPNRGSVKSGLRSNDEGTVLSKICWVQLPDLRRFKFVPPKK